MIDIQPKILVLTNTYPDHHKPYASWYVSRHVLLHREAGLDVTVLTPGDNRRGSIRSIWKYIKYSLQVLHTMLWGEFDLVHAHRLLPAGLFGVILSWWRRKPLVLTTHGVLSFIDLENVEAKPRLVHKLVVKVLQSADVVIAVGRQLMLQHQAIGDLPNERLHCINMGVWLDELPPSRSEARRLLGLPEKKKIIISIGNLFHHKGLDVLVRAVSLLAENESQFKLIIGGQGPEKQNVLEMIKDLGLGKAASVIGTIQPENVMMWFSAADVAVVPSRTEGFGLTAIEAMASRTPVVASDVGGLRETITHRENGLLFPVGDHIALAKCLREVLTNDDLRERIVERGFQTATTHDMRLKADQVKAIYEELLSRQNEH